MKKRFLIASAVLGMASLSVFTSCKKDENKPVINSGEATVKGIVKAPVDYTKYGFDMNGDSTGIDDFYQYSKYLEFAPVGTKVIVTYDEKDLISSGGTSNTKTIETEVGADGVYEVKIPTGSKSYSVKVELPDFEKDAILPKFSKGNDKKFIMVDPTKKNGMFKIDLSTTKRSVLKAGTKTVGGVVNGTTKIVDIEFDTDLDIISEIQTLNAE